MRKREVSVVFVSRWSKENEICTVHSKRKEGDKTARFWFTGYNPFPCFYMMSTYTCVSGWLEGNGWKKDNFQRVSYTTDIIDDATGEILEHNCSVYNTRVIREKAEEKTIPELIKAGRKVSAVKAYKGLTGCSLREAVVYVDLEKERLGL